VSEYVVCELKTIVLKPETIFSLAGETASVVMKIFWFEKTMASRIESIISVMQTIFTMTATTVTAAQIIVSAVPAVF